MLFFLYESVASTSRAQGTSSEPKVKHEKRKRRLKDGSASPKHFKKRRVDENGQHLSIRRGTPIGKIGVLKLRKKAQRRQIQRGEGVFSPPNLKSNPDSKTVSLNLSKLPLVSVRLRPIPIEDHVCVEVKKKKTPSWLVKHRRTSSSSSSIVIEEINDLRMMKEKPGLVGSIFSSMCVAKLKEVDCGDVYKSREKNNNEQARSSVISEEQSLPHKNYEPPIDKSKQVKLGNFEKASDDSESGILENEGDLSDGDGDSLFVKRNLSVSRIKPNKEVDTESVHIMEDEEKSENGEISPASSGLGFSDPDSRRDPGLP